jgi:hypothetical protein
LGSQADASPADASPRRGALRSSVRRRLRARYGLWPLHELRNKALGWPGAVRLRAFEAAEVRRLAAATDAVIPTAIVTTVVPTYRRPEALLAAVRSALAQDVPSHAVIVVDDGAGLPDLPADPRLVAVSLRRNTGSVAVVRNVGLRLARSPFVAFLDDDNTWRPDHLRLGLAALESGADVVYTAVRRLRPDGSTLDVLSTPFDRRALAEEDCFVDTNAVVARLDRGVRFSRLPRPRGRFPREDWELVWRLSRSRRVVHVPEPTVLYAVNPASYYTAWQADDTAVGEGPGLG